MFSSLNSLRDRGSNPAAAAIVVAAGQGEVALLHSISLRGDSPVFALLPFLQTIMTIVKNLTKKSHGMVFLSLQLAPSIQANLQIETTSLRPLTGRLTRKRTRAQLYLPSIYSAPEHLQSATFKLCSLLAQTKSQLEQQLKALRCSKKSRL